MLEFLGSLISSILGGGITGIAGVAVQRIADYFNKKLDLQANDLKYKHELEMKKADAEIMAQEWAGRTKVAEVEGQSASDVADTQAFQASFLEPSAYSQRVNPTPGQGWTLVALDLIRGLVRPCLTLYLCMLTTLVYLHARALVGSTGLNQEQAFAQYKLLINTVTYLTTTCVLWWFGTRNRGKPKLGV